MNLKLTSCFIFLMMALGVFGQPLTQSELAWRTPTGGGLFDIPPTAGTLFLLYPAGTNMPITLPGGDDSPGYTFSIGASPTNGLISNLSALAGTLDYTNTTGSNNDYFNYTVHEADGPLTAFGEVYINTFTNSDTNCLTIPFYFTNTIIVTNSVFEICLTNTGGGIWIGTNPANTTICFMYGGAITNQVITLSGSNNCFTYVIYSNQFLIPFMTGYSSPSNSASASRESSGNFAYDAFQWNQSVANTVSVWVSGGSAPQWVKYTFDYPQSPVVDRYYVLFASSFGGSTQSFQLQASNDGFIATTNILDTETGITGSTGVNTFNLNNNTHYSSYRLYITSVSGVFGANGSFQLYGHF